MSALLSFPRKRESACALGLLLMAGCAGGARILSPTQAAEESYLLQPGDELQISVFGNLQLEHKATVGDDGMFLFPGLGEISAADRSIETLEMELQKRLLQKYSPEQEPGPGGEAPVTQRTVSPGEVRDLVYRVQPGDALKVSVWNHSELSVDVNVREDGSFPYPLIGEVQAAGRSVRELQQEIAERLNRDYIVNPEVTVGLGNTSFTILGQVAKPGSYPTDGTLDLLAALSLAGGVSGGTSSEVEIIRMQGNEKLLIRVDADQVLQGNQPNLRVLPHDTINVKLLASEGVQVTLSLVGAKFTAIGEVSRPGQYDITGALDLLTAVSQAGGITKFGSSRVEIIRQRGKERIVIRADIERILRGKQPNIRLHPHDTLNVRRRFI